jgi:hypothetical protein
MTGFGIAFMENTETGRFQFCSTLHTLPHELFDSEESAKRRVEELDRAEKADKYFVF